MRLRRTRFVSSAPALPRAWLVLAALAAVACEAADGAPTPPPGPGGGGEVDGGPSSCVRPDEGCPCEPGTEPVECYPEPVVVDGERVCLGAGERYCRDGAWTACEVAPYERTPGVVTAPLITGPTQCNACDPRCFEYVDQPTTPGDVTSGNSSGVVLRPGGTGVELPPSGTYMGSGDRDGDGVPDDFDAFPTDPTRDGFTEEGGIFHLLPEGATEGPDPISISTTINAADVYVLMDATASMAGEISTLRNALTSGNYLGGTLYPSRAVSGNEAMGSAYDFGTDPLPGVYPVTGTTAGMANDHAAGCSGGGTAADAVFRFTLTSEQTVMIETLEPLGYDTVLSLRNSTFGEVQCVDDVGGSRRSQITRTLAAGTYYILLEGWNGGAGTYAMNVQFQGSSACRGILGAINCIIPNAQFGVGYFREYPLTPYGSSENPVYVHVQDVTSDFTAVQNAVNGLVTQGNVDWPESMAQGLYSTVTGNGLGTYYPARGSNPSFSACPAGRWGYGCFRTGAIPIVIGFSDAPMHEGPDRQFDYAFDQRWPAATTVSLEQGGSASMRYRNDTQATAWDMGDITATVGSNQQVVYAGRTRWTQGSSTYRLGNDYDTAVVGCNGSGEDAVFRFTLTQRRRVQLTTYSQFSSYDTVLSLFRSSVTAANRVTCSDDIYFSGTASMITTVLDPGTYYVVVDGWDGADGSYYLSVNGRVPTDGSPPYPSAQAPAYWEHTSHALRARNVKFIGIRSCSDGASGDEGTFCPDLLQDLRDVGIATGSVDDSGEPFVYTISNSGSGLDSTVVQAVQRLANYSRMDVSARATDDPATAFDERNFVQSITINNCPASRCTGPRTGSMCGQCLPGSDVGFDVVFHNTGVAPTGVPRTAVAQVFDFTLELVGDGTYVLDSVPVRIVVPPVRAEYPASGTYWRDYDSTARCADNERPDWGSLAWTATTPAGTSIEFQLQAADDPAGIPGAPRASILVPGSTSPRPILPALRARGYADGLRHLRVTAVLSSDALRSSTPNLERMAVDYTCVPAE
ncbi:hypothetical protein [Sandaracinus amylolyticus]|uniref:Internalin n=1 Tax=Sandaracinus amylolyticus TaxID=927083 RepID=A0A0F6SGY5_9BACT|nr:hypothetical protein [Sandaracinus amylolyticus]AKF09504.1 internalin [Sandaracinus amylolyticus]